MDRKTLMAALRVAGYHEDQKAFMRLYCGNRISAQKAHELYLVGRDQRLSGVGCTCSQCRGSAE